MGMDGFVWFYGVVEDRNDPLKIGRIRVRCFGWHSQDKTELPTENLPWAIPIQPIISAASSGIGHSPVGPIEGTWVMGFFQDGDVAQEPVVMGTLAGIPGDPDTNIRTRNEGVTNRTPESVTGGNNSSWDEPNDPYAAQYPKNHSMITESGHVEEFDDTPGAERIIRQHKSGSFEEYHPNGDKVTKIVGKNYEIISQDDNLYIKGNCNITIDQNCTIKVNGDSYLEVAGDLTTKTTGTHTIDSDTKVVLTAPKFEMVKK